ncbi:hypothetical protein MJO28_003222 [Puccinia striiformis f. sp. tritici]|uniref:Uncharacterized protein n=1 Tax=Puccinia striiformis f. sp. tritici TaxID=168172 RepID=A0ACC0EU65_9BASI|nr:hypothetical protein MJO29_016899 [Puccinia striiformis f. sp. tritici]KAI7959431.1 hypothetical protein MJO28_003222 [Puccinia striiformis f. sp. tritici]KAI7965186.1 hypothetical protein MJO29_003284 [Puccinia striiformis f. sp. tritici]
MESYGKWPTGPLVIRWCRKCFEGAGTKRSHTEESYPEDVLCPQVTPIPASPFIIAPAQQKLLQAQRSLPPRRKSGPLSPKSLMPYRKSRPPPLPAPGSTAHCRMAVPNKRKHPSAEPYPKTKSARAEPKSTSKELKLPADQVTIERAELSDPDLIEKPPTQLWGKFFQGHPYKHSKSQPPQISEALPQLTSWESRSRCPNTKPDSTALIPQSAALAFTLQSFPNPHTTTFSSKSSPA